MSERAVIVDDADPSITYVGSSWRSDQGSHDQVGNFGPPFMGTLHGTDSSASLSFQFSCTSFKVYGSTDNPNNSAGSGPRWDCFIDQQIVSALKPPVNGENSQHFCELQGGFKLGDGPHTLTVNVTTAQNQTFWFDRIEYVPSPTVSLENSLILVESNDAKFRYGQGWRTIGTANMTQTNGALFEFEFTVGISISWISWVLDGYPENATTGTYAINGGSPQTFYLNGKSSTLYNQKLFETPTLPMGQHNLSVRYNGNKNMAPLFLDYLVVRNGTGIGIGASTAPPNASAISTNIADDDSNHLLPTKNSNIGAIVGGVVAPVGLIIILILVFIFLRRRQRSHESHISVAQVEPFQAQDQSNHPSSLAWGHYRDSIQAQSANSPHGSSGSALRRKFDARPGGGGDIHSNSAATTSLHTAPTPPADIADSLLHDRTGEVELRGLQPSNSESTLLRVIRHEDSGRRDVHHVHPLDDVIELPPQYTHA